MVAPTPFVRQNLRVDPSKRLHVLIKRAAFSHQGKSPSVPLVTKPSPCGILSHNRAASLNRWTYPPQLQPKDRITTAASTNPTLPHGTHYTIPPITSMTHLARVNTRTSKQKNTRPPCGVFSKRRKNNPPYFRLNAQHKHPVATKQTPWLARYHCTSRKRRLDHTHIPRG